MNKALSLVLIGVALCLAFAPGAEAACAASVPVFHAFDSYFVCADTGPVAGIAYQLNYPAGVHSGSEDIVSEGVPGDGHVQIATDWGNAGFIGCPAYLGAPQRIVQRLGVRRPELRRGILLSAYLADPVAAMRGVGATTLWQEWQQVDRELVNRVHDAGFSLIAWTVNEIGDLERMARLGVDGLCGNYPDRIRVAIATRVEEVSRT